MELDDKHIKTRKEESSGKKIHVSSLELGMYVSKLDRDWLDTPFLMQGFLIESKDEIEILEEICEYVWIDAVAEKHAKQNIPLASTNSTIRYINKLPPQDEHRRIIGTYQEAKRTTKAILDGVRFSNVINSNVAKKTVNKCLFSVFQNSTALMWMSKVRSEDEYIAEHSLNVCILAIAFGRELGFTEHELKNIGLCGLLHDVGKLRIDPKLFDSEHELTTQEKRILRAYPFYGRNLLMSTPGIYHGAVDVVYCHQEREDGSGFPRGILGNAIPRYAKIIAIIDTYDSLINPRDPEKALSCTDALKEIYKVRDTKFNKELSLAFIRAVGTYPTGGIVELENGEVGVILERNKHLHHLPKIVTVLNKNKQPKSLRVLDLARINEGKLSQRFLIKRVCKDGSFGLYGKDFDSKGNFLGERWA